MKNDKLKIGIIGLGKRGKTHLRIYQKISDIELVAISDIGKICSFNIPKNVKFFDDYREMIQIMNLDAVSICIPPCFHYEISKVCIENKIHVIAEKPMTLSSSDINSLICQAEKKNVIIMPGYNYLFDKEIQKIKLIIESGELGVISMVRGRQSHNWGGKEPFEWSIEKKKSGGGTLIDNCSHYLSLFEFLFGKIEKLQAFASNISFNTSVEDNAIISLQFNIGTLGTIESSWGDASGRNNEIIIYGNKGVLEWKETNDKKTFEIRKYISEENEWNRIVRQCIYLPKGVEQLSKKKNIDNTQSLSLENTENLLNYFVRSIKTQELPLKYLNNAKATQKLVECAYKSINESKVVSIM